MAFLYPYAELLGMDVRYREDNGEHHQWIESTLRPRMTTWTTDLYHHDAAPPGNDRLLACPIAESYAGLNATCGGYPSAKRKVLSGKPILHAGVEDGDWA